MAFNQYGVKLRSRAVYKRKCQSLARWPIWIKLNHHVKTGEHYKAKESSAKESSACKKVVYNKDKILLRRRMGLSQYPDIDRKTEYLILIYVTVWHKLVFSALKGAPLLSTTSERAIQNQNQKYFNNPRGKLFLLFNICKKIFTNQLVFNLNLFHLIDLTPIFCKTIMY